MSVCVCFPFIWVLWKWKMNRVKTNLSNLGRGQKKGQWPFWCPERRFWIFLNNCSSTLPNFQNPKAGWWLKLSWLGFDQFVKGQQRPAKAGAWLSLAIRLFNHFLLHLADYCFASCCIIRKLIAEIFHLLWTLLNWTASAFCNYGARW